MYAKATTHSASRCRHSQNTGRHIGNRCTLSKKLFTLLDLCVSSLRRGHANLLCIVPILTDDPRRESKWTAGLVAVAGLCCAERATMSIDALHLLDLQEFSLGGFGSLSLSGIWRRSVGKQCMSCKLCGWLALTKLVVCKGPAT